MPNPSRLVPPVTAVRAEAQWYCDKCRHLNVGNKAECSQCRSRNPNHVKPNTSKVRAGGGGGVGQVGPGLGWAVAGVWKTDGGGSWAGLSWGWVCGERKLRRALERWGMQWWRVEGENVDTGLHTVDP